MWIELTSETGVKVTVNLNLVETIMRRPDGTAILKIAGRDVSVQEQYSNITRNIGQIFM
jgi:uncharacterized protein YlzI (FlbEa/FlbD family)